jgi:hypothetical protein
MLAKEPHITLHMPCHAMGLVVVVVVVVVGSAFNGETTYRRNTVKSNCKYEVYWKVRRLLLL